jgi:hypothetical protein
MNFHLRCETENMSLTKQSPDLPELETLLVMEDTSVLLLNKSHIPN